ncbi:MAG: acetyltransferase [Pseudomonadales bacterium]
MKEVLTSCKKQNILFQKRLIANMREASMSRLYQDKPVVIFGSGAFAELAAHVLQFDAKRAVAGFTVDAEYIKSNSLAGRKIVAFEDASRLFPSDTHEMILPLGYSKINQTRMNRMNQAKAMGYKIINFISTYAIISEGVDFSENTLIYEQAILQAHVKVGTNVIVRAGANIGHHSRIGDHSFIASNVVTGGNVTIGEFCFVGLGAVLRDSVKLGDRSFVGAGAVLISDTEPDSVYVGNPARRTAKTSLEVTNG